jgi:hypothetical protein
MHSNFGVFNLCQHFEISYSRYANKYYITGVYIAIKRQWQGRIRIIYKTVTGKIQDHILDSDREESGSYIRQWQGRIRFFPVTVLYMISILPSHCLIYDPDSSPSLSYIWSRFFPVTVLYMILNLPSHCLIYDPDSSPSLSYKTVTGKIQDHI